MIEHIGYLLLGAFIGTNVSLAIMFICKGWSEDRKRMAEEMRKRLERVSQSPSAERRLKLQSYGVNHNMPLKY